MPIATLVLFPVAKATMFLLLFQLVLLFILSLYRHRKDKNTILFYPPHARSARSTHPQFKLTARSKYCTYSSKYLSKHYFRDAFISVQPHMLRGIINSIRKKYIAKFPRRFTGDVRDKRSLDKTRDIISIIRSSALTTDSSSLDTPNYKFRNEQ